MPQRQLGTRLRPLIRLTPLQERMHRRPPRGPLVSNCIKFWLLGSHNLMQFGGAAEAEDALHVEAVGALFVSADRGVGEGAAGDDRRLALDQGRRAFAELAGGGALPV